MRAKSARQAKKSATRAKRPKIAKRAMRAKWAKQAKKDARATEACEVCEATRCARRSESRADNSLFEPVRTIIGNSLPTSAGQRYATTERFMYESTTSYHGELPRVGLHRPKRPSDYCVA